MALSPEKQVEQNITGCENILDILDTIEDSELGHSDIANIYIKISEIRSDVEELKELYQQIII